MIFDKWKAITSQAIVNQFMNATLKKETKNGLSKEMLQSAFDSFSYNLDYQYKAYAIYDAEVPEDFTKLCQICRGI